MLRQIISLKILGFYYNMMGPLSGWWHFVAVDCIAMILEIHTYSNFKPRLLSEGRSKNLKKCSNTTCMVSSPTCWTYIKPFYAYLALCEWLFFWWSELAFSIVSSNKCSNISHIAGDGVNIPGSRHFHTWPHHKCDSCKKRLWWHGCLLLSWKQHLWCHCWVRNYVPQYIMLNEMVSFQRHFNVSPLSFIMKIFITL